jgi:tRNA G18 (ribose-2'-O)-methylase SpoU
MTDQQLIRHFEEARRHPDAAILEGFHAVKHALRFGADIKLIVYADISIGVALEAGDVWPLIQERGTEVGPELFAQLMPRQHPTGVVALARRSTVNLDSLFEAGIAPLVILEDPRRAENVGAAIRVAAGAGLGGIVTLGGVDPWTPDAMRAAAGLQYALPVGKVSKLPATRRPIWAIDPSATEELPVPIPNDAILLFGTERQGISDALLGQADRRLRIPMQPQVSSLNLATSVAVLAYSWRLGKGAVQ